MTKRRRVSLSAIDLFAGCGGATVGMKKAGFSVIGAVELDPLAASTYSMNHRNVRLWQSDIRAVEGRAVLKDLGLRRGDLDLLLGCPPCQGFSRLRNLNGGARVREPRNTLLFEFLRFVDELQPRAFMLENVPGLARHYSFGLLLRGLRNLGYQTSWTIFDAADFGVPQRRARVLILGSQRSAIPFPAPEQRLRTVRDAISHLPAVSKTDDPAHRLMQNRSPRIRALIRKIPKNGGSRAGLPSSLSLACHRRCDGFADVYGRMRWDDVAPTITGGFVNPSKGRFLHPVANRTITIREGALLQTFPAHYRFPVEAGKFPVASLIGNAVPPELIRRQALCVRQHLEGR